MTGKQINVFWIMRPIYMITPYKDFYKVMRRNLQPTKPETPGQTPSLNEECTGFFLRALHNTRDLQLYVPSEGRSNYG